MRRSNDGSRRWGGTGSGDESGSRDGSHYPGKGRTVKDEYGGPRAQKLPPTLADSSLPIGEQVARGDVERGFLEAVGFFDEKHDATHEPSTEPTRELVQLAPDVAGASPAITAV